MLDVRLVVKKGPAKVREVRLRSEDTVVGRQRECDLRIASNEVSRRHCLLSTQAGYLTVEDLHSSNGTFLNGKRIKSKEIVRPGDKLSMGPLTFVAKYQLTQKAMVQLMAAEQGLEVVEEEEVTDLEVVEESESLPEDDEALPLAVDEDAKTVTPGYIPKGELEPEEEEEAVAELEEIPDWHLPEQDELRSVLTNLEEDPDKPKAKSKKKK